MTQNYSKIFMGFEHEYLAQFPTVLKITAQGHLQEI